MFQKPVFTTLTMLYTTALLLIYLKTRLGDYINNLSYLSFGNLHSTPPPFFKKR